jgi:hypothetical protein
MVHTRPLTLAELAKTMSVSRTHALNLCKLLQERGWAMLQKKSRGTAIVPLLPNVAQLELVDILKRTRPYSPFLGEYIMKKWLDLLIATNEYIDNARPEFLVNPRTKQTLEYDRLYLCGVAYEFNGDQHYVMTRHHQNRKSLDEQQSRDLTKIRLSRNNNIILYEVTDEDLSIEGMQSIIPSILPQTQITNGPYVQALSALSKKYRYEMSWTKGNV